MHVLGGCTVQVQKFFVLHMIQVSMQCVCMGDLSVIQSEAVFWASKDLRILRIGCGDGKVVRLVSGCMCLTLSSLSVTSWSSVSFRESLPFVVLLLVSWHQLLPPFV